MQQVPELNLLRFAPKIDFTNKSRRPAGMPSGLWVHLGRAYLYAEFWIDAVCMCAHGRVHAHICACAHVCLHADADADADADAF